MDLSLIKRVLSCLPETSDLTRLFLIQAEALDHAHVPPFPPEFPVLITSLRSIEQAAHLTTILQTIYPSEHPIHWLDGQQTWQMHLADPIPSLAEFPLSCYLPPLPQGTSFETFLEVVAHLRAPDGCPWDRQQTHASLRTHLLQETYEALEAIDADNPEAMQEEFGDLLLQIVLQTQIASEAGRFSITNVLRGIHDKIIRRHPHVFGDVLLDNVQGVLHNWERLKERERNQSASEKKRKEGLLDGVPQSLPALTQAQEYQDRAARVGFDWSEIEGVLEKIREEIDEVTSAPSVEQAASEIGDLLFTLVNLARWKTIDAESALRQANLRFKKRLSYLEQQAWQRGKNLSDLTPDEMDALWNEAKQREIAGE